jgi:hypothetical protein
VEGEGPNQLGAVMQGGYLGTGCTGGAPAHPYGTEYESACGAKGYAGCRGRRVPGTGAPEVQGGCGAAGAARGLTCS